MAHSAISGTAESCPRRPLKLVAVETHPIQYKAPLFRALAKHAEIDLKVLYAMLPDAAAQGQGFGVSFEWDQPLLDGYAYEIMHNRAKHPSVTRFGGCDTPEITAQLRRERPNAVLVNGWVVKSCLQALLACRHLGVPCIVRGEANLLRKRAPWKHALHRLLLRQYQGYCAIGSANRDFYRFHGCPESRIFPAPYSIDNAFFAAQAHERKSQRRALRQHLGLSENVVVFLFCGKLETKKHPGDLLRALALLPPEIKTSVQALFVGAGPLLENIKNIAAELEVPACFTGFMNQSRLPDAYAASDALVLPSDAGETWGLVINEAMASGRPALVSRGAGACQDLIIEGQTGFSFDCGDTATLAQHLETCARNPKLLTDMGLKAAQLIDRFSIARTAEGVVQAVRALSKP